jgi:GNAT superfamily N-acetyltransferase
MYQQTERHDVVEHRNDGMSVVIPAEIISSVGPIPSSEIAPTIGRRREVLPSHFHNPCLRELRRGTKIVAGNAGDHCRVLSFLSRHYQAALGDDFQSRLDEPSYEPSDRLLLVHRGEMLGHAQVSRQSLWFDHERLPVAAIRDFAVLPEMHSAGLREPLLETAEETALAEGAVLAIARAEDPEFFAARGWSTYRSQGHTRANTCSLLAHITAQQAARKHRHAHTEIRTWWHFELESIQPVYEQVAAGMWGTIQRNDDAWRWLVGRKAHEQILLALKHKGEAASDSGTIQVIGYAVVRDSNIVEMFTLPGHSGVRPLLVARACRDAIDRDHHFVSLHTPPTDPLHELLVTAGGSWISGSAQAGQWMGKLLSPEKWVERLYPQLYRRAREAGIPRPLEIGFAVDEQRYRFVFTRRSVRLEHALPSATVDITCDAAAFQDLLLSNLAWPAAIDRGRLRLENSKIAPVLTALFPPRLFWQSPFELLRL